MQFGPSTTISPNAYNFHRSCDTIQSHPRMRSTPPSNARGDMEMASRSVSPSARYTQTGVSTACSTSPATNNTPAGPGSPDCSRLHSCATEELTKQCYAPSSTRIVTGMLCPVGAMTHPRICGFTPGSCRFHGVNSAYMRFHGVNSAYMPNTPSR